MQKYENCEMNNETKREYSYFRYRNAALGSTLSSQISDQRNELGKREVETLLILINPAEKKNFLSGKVVVDLGCGDQYLKKPFEDYGSIYTGIDIDKCNLETDRFPMPSNSVDIAISLALVEHIFNPDHFFDEVQRVLVPGGLLWLSTPDIKACGNSFWDDPTHVHPYTRNSLRTTLLMNGFNDVLVTPNYRCMPSCFYRDTDLNFFIGHRLLPLKGSNRWPLPAWLKGRCSGLFGLAKLG